MEMTVVVTEVVALGRGLGGTAFSEQAALTTLGSKVCRMTGVVMVRRPVTSVKADDVGFMTAVVSGSAATSLLNAAVTSPMRGNVELLADDDVWLLADVV